MTHTPGPWTSTISPTGTVLVEASVLQDTSAWNYIAEVVTVHGNGEANAHLMAAAPNMLSALKLVAENEECVCGDGRCARCGGAEDIHPSQTHEFISPEPCLGCQVDAVIKLAEKGE